MHEIDGNSVDDVVVSNSISRHVHIQESAILERRANKN